MDGTIYLDNDLFDGTLDFLDYVKAIGGRYIFLTNNSSKGVDKYIEKLASMGIEATADDFMTSVNATIEYMKPRAYHKIYVSCPTVAVRAKCSKEPQAAPQNSSVSPSPTWCILPAKRRVFHLMRPSSLATDSTPTSKQASMQASAQFLCSAAKPLWMTWQRVKISPNMCSKI